MVKQPSQTRVRRKEKKNVTNAVAHVNSSFNNTVVTITDIQGNAISWSSSGSMGFKVYNLTSAMYTCICAARTHYFNRMITNARQRFFYFLLYAIYMRLTLPTTVTRRNDRSGKTKNMLSSGATLWRPMPTLCLVA